MFVLLTVKLWELHGALISSYRIQCKGLSCEVCQVTHLRSSDERGGKGAFCKYRVFKSYQRYQVKRGGFWERIWGLSRVVKLTRGERRLQQGPQTFSYCYWKVTSRGANSSMSLL